MATGVVRSTAALVFVATTIHVVFGCCTREEEIHCCLPGPACTRSSSGIAAAQGDSSCQIAHCICNSCLAQHVHARAEVRAGNHTHHSFRCRIDHCRFVEEVSRARSESRSNDSHLSLIAWCGSAYTRSTNAAQALSLPPTPLHNHSTRSRSVLQVWLL